MSTWKYAPIQGRPSGKVRPAGAATSSVRTATAMIAAATQSTSVAPYTIDVAALGVRAMATASNATPSNAATQSMRIATALIGFESLGFLSRVLGLLCAGGGLSQPDTAPSALAYGAFCDQFDAALVERADQFHQGIDIAPDDAGARFHSLDRGDRKLRQLCELALIDTEQRPGSAHLHRRDHGLVVISQTSVRLS